MAWSWSNIDWNGTGAMVQAVGSVAAIIAAIWIDQGTARRQRRLQQEADAEARVQRRRAVENAAEVVENVAREVATATITETRYFSLPDTMHRSLDASGELVAFFLRQGGEVDAHLAITLAHTAEVLVRVREIYPRSMQVRPSTRARTVELVQEQADVIRELLREYDHGVW